MNQTNKPVQVVSPYLSQLKEAKLHLDRSSCELLHEMGKTGEYNDKYNINITINGKTFFVELHADSHSRLERLLDEEIDEFVEITKGDDIGSR